MFDPSQIFVSLAMAQDAAATAAPAAPDAGPLAGLMNYVPFILIFGVFYVLVIRPQQKKLADQEKMIKALQRGDRIVTSGGIHGKVTKLEDTEVMIEIADGVQIKIDRGHVQGLESKPVPVPATGSDLAKTKT